MQDPRSMILVCLVPAAAVLWVHLTIYETIPVQRILRHPSPEFKVLFGTFFTLLSEWVLFRVLSILKWKGKSELMEVALRGAHCGLMISGGIFFLRFQAMNYDSRWPIAAYVISWSYVFLTEYVFTALFNPSNLSYRSLLLDAFPMAHVAGIMGCTEHMFWSWWGKPTSFERLLSIVALFQFVIGDVIRKVAIYQLGQQFTVDVNNPHRTPTQAKRLMRSGLYAMARHPSYVGLFLIMTSHMMLMRSPITLLLSVPTFWIALKRRIEIEEEFLRKEFEEYEEYEQEVPVGFVPKRKMSRRLSETLTIAGEELERLTTGGHVRFEFVH